MKHKAFGQSGVTLPVVGQGTWKMERDANPVEALRAGLDLGMTHVDTAEMYGNGRVEELVGEAIRGRRDEIYLVSKVLPSNATTDGTISACERSLRRLGTDCLDLYLLHWPGGHPLADTVEGFVRLRDAGKIRAFGVSNFDADDLEEVARLEVAAEVQCNQVLYNPLQRTVENRVLPRCRDLGMSVVAYSPLVQGQLPRADTRPAAALARIAADRGAVPSQILLAFLLRHRDVFVIPKASSLAHVEENAGAGEIELHDAEIEALERSFPPAPADDPLPIN